MRHYLFIIFDLITQVILVITVNHNFRHRVLIFSDHSHKHHNRSAQREQCINIDIILNDVLLYCLFSTCIKAETVQTAIIAFNSWATQEIRLYDNGQSVEIEWTVGPVPIDDQIGKEIILRYDTDIKSQAKYYTDANGREVLERTRNSRPTWNYTGDEPVSSNYYPINSRIWIKEDNRQFTVLTGKMESIKYFSFLQTEYM